MGSPKKARCNGIANCGDGSDENGCQNVYHDGKAKACVRSYRRRRGGPRRRRSGHPIVMAPCDHTQGDSLLKKKPGMIKWHWEGDRLRNENYGYLTSEEPNTPGGGVNTDHRDRG